MRTPLHLAFLAITFLSVAAATVANAQNTPPAPTPSPTPAPLPKIVRTPGEQVHWTMTDGREAGLTIIRRPSANWSSKLALSDTSCETPMTDEPKCSLSFPIKLITLAAVWTKHPDHAKIGTPVSVYSPGSELSSDSIFNQYHQLTSPIGADMKPTVLACDDFTWLSESKEAPATIQLANLSGETMTSNPETGIPENRTFVGVFSPELTRKSNHELEFTRTGRWFTAFGNEPDGWFFGSSILNFMTMPSNAKPACQTAFKPDFSTLQDDYNQLKKTGTSEPYLEGSDLYFEALMKSQFSTFKNATEFATEDRWF